MLFVLNERKRVELKLNKRQLEGMIIQHVLGKFKIIFAKNDRCSNLKFNVFFNRIRTFSRYFCIFTAL